MLQFKEQDIFHFCKLCFRNTTIEFSSESVCACLSVCVFAEQLKKLSVLKSEI